MKTPIFYSFIAKCILFICLLTSCSKNNEEVREEISLSIYAPDIADTASVFIVGNHESLGDWDPAKIKMTNIGNHTWNTTFERPDSNFLIQYKYTLGAWEHQPSTSRGRQLDNFYLDPEEKLIQTDSIYYWSHLDYPSSGTFITGKVDLYEDFPMDTLLPRKVLVWMPPAYDPVNQSYPVLYMHDGENVIDALTSNYGSEWELDETLDSLIRKSEIDSLIVVAVHSSTDRGKEYGPGETGISYMNWVLNTLKPFIDSTYSTKIGPEHTLSGGSSLAALISYRLGNEHPEVFGGVLAMSPILYYQGLDYTDAIELSPYVPTCFYIDIGGLDLDVELLPGYEKAVSLMKQQGYADRGNMKAVHVKGHRHFESAWALRFPAAIKWCMDCMKNRPAPN